MMLNLLFFLFEVDDLHYLADHFAIVKDAFLSIKSIVCVLLGRRRLYV